jgi:hypothetical protein
MRQQERLSELDGTLPFGAAVLHVFSEVVQELICVSRFRYRPFYCPIDF